jgi:hypothetical protein
VAVERMERPTADRKDPRSPMHENRALPDGIVARLEALGQQSTAFARAHRDASLGELERGVLDLVRQALPELLGEVIKLSASGLDHSLSRLPEPCPTCGQRTRVQSWREREVMTVCGKVRFERPWYVCRGCRHGFSPVDISLELVSRARLSAELRTWLVELGAKTSFADAAGLLERLTGLEVAPETVRLHTEGKGIELEEAQQAATAEVERTGESAEAVDPAPGMLVVETDGVMVRYLNGWHEVKLGLVGGHVDGKLVDVSYLALRASPDEFGPRLLAEAAQ